ncbi:hypothetical protein Cgig2_006699 [Carnegiea gigantea]|uniref:Uncharacterized protein n=1 Tax=Carnegiea gigantea TaxID=171969 RepID=A0A9Q1JSJ5_9CARY|nr:hypothetical protein Cgig2_006699 [Carnegiea gigantea]
MLQLGMLQKSGHDENDGEEEGGGGGDKVSLFGVLGMIQGGSKKFVALERKSFDMVVESRVNPCILYSLEESVAFANDMLQSEDGNEGLRGPYAVSSFGSSMPLIKANASSAPSSLQLAVGSSLPLNRSPLPHPFLKLKYIADYPTLSDPFMFQVPLGTPGYSNGTTASSYSSYLSFAPPEVIE